MKNKTVLLLDGQTIQAIASAKCLKKSGYTVVLFCDSKMTYGYFTRYAHKKVLSPSTNSDNFFYFLENFLKNNHIDVIIPMNDDSAFFLTKNKEHFSRFSNFIIPDLYTFELGYNKGNLMKVCADNNFSHPQTIDLEENTPNEEFPFPALIKPNITSGGRGITYVKSVEDFNQIYPEIRKSFGNCHLQEFIPSGGKQYKVQLFVDKNGSITNSSVIDKIRYYPESGGSSCCNQTVVNDELVELCSKVLQKINWIGFADFDLIEDPRNGVIKIMEINPRLPACIKSSYVSGVDFATIIANETLDIKNKTYKYTPGYYLRYLGFEILWFLKSKNRFRTQPSWFRFISRKTFYQDAVFDDFLSFIVGNIGGFMKQLSPEFRKKKSGLKKK